MTTMENDGLELKSFNGIRRTGQWTVEEEAYSDKMIQLFLNGQLIIAPDDGRSLRTYLAKKLVCDPMRISKKYTNLNCLGYHYCHSNGRYEELLSHEKSLKSYESDFWKKDAVVRSRRLVRKKYYKKNRNPLTKDVDYSESSVTKRVFSDICEECPKSTPMTPSNTIHFSPSEIDIPHQSSLQSNKKSENKHENKKNDSYGDYSSAMIDAAHILACRFYTE
mmetsp:Transcript_34618/g.35304  ORF Transcript_34618/g.35304 Transcript_34618/m.35304 type:complete len:221 (+) Transcript_34618:96-758(+)